MKISADIHVIDSRMPEGGRQELLAIDNVYAMDAKKSVMPDNFRYCINRKKCLCCCSFNSDICKNGCLQIATKGEAAVLVISDGCENCYDNDIFRRCKVCGKRFNLFYLNGENDFLLKRNRQHGKNYMFVILSKERLKYLAEYYPSLLEPEKTINNGSFSPLFEPGEYYAPEICHVLGQIQSCSLDKEIIPTYIEAKILELLAVTYNAQKKKEEVLGQDCVLGKVHKARKIVEEHYENAPSLRELALMIGTNETTLKANFKKLYKTSVYNYLMNYRLDKARELLSEGEHSIVNVAKKVGYENQGNFTTSFKRKFGLTPTEFVKKKFG